MPTGTAMCAFTCARKFRLHKQPGTRTFLAEYWAVVKGKAAAKPETHKLSPGKTHVALAVRAIFSVG